MRLRHWSFAKVALVSIGWVVAYLALAVAWSAVSTYRSAGSGGIGAVSAGISEAIVETVVIPFGPPLLLIVAWLIARSSR